MVAKLDDCFCSNKIVCRALLDRQRFSFQNYFPTSLSSPIVQDQYPPIDRYRFRQPYPTFVHASINHPIPRIRKSPSNPATIDVLYFQSYPIVIIEIALSSSICVASHIRVTDPDRYLRTAIKGTIHDIIASGLEQKRQSQGLLHCQHSRLPRLYISGLLGTLPVCPPETQSLLGPFG